MSLIGISSYRSREETPTAPPIGRQDGSELQDASHGGCRRSEMSLAPMPSLAPSPSPTFSVSLSPTCFPPSHVAERTFT